MKLKFPQGVFTFGDESSDALILVAGGRPPALGWLAEVADNYPLWAVDRGADVCRSASLIPDRLIGDADSSSAESWRWVKEHGIPVVHHPVDKDLTDLQLALLELGQQRPGVAALVTGGMGGRFDHAFSNVFSLLEAQREGIKPLGLIDDSEALFLLQGGNSFQADFSVVPAIISLLPLSPVCEEVSSDGVHWPLEAATLNMESPGGICNRLAAGSRSITVSLGRGQLGVYLCWDEQRL